MVKNIVLARYCKVTEVIAENFDTATIIQKRGNHCDLTVACQIVLWGFLMLVGVCKPQLSYARGRS